MTAGQDAQPIPAAVRRSGGHRPPLILASASPRRRELLAQLGIAFEVVVPEVDERPFAGESATALARRLARAKAEAVSAAHPDAMVLAADTVVTHAGQLYGKPDDAVDACRMLTELRGQHHMVITGVCVTPARSAMQFEAATQTEVWMRDYAATELAAYVATGAPLDKAGAYAIQDTAFRPVARIAGCYTNVVGLPLCTARELLAAAGLSLPVEAANCRHT